MSKMLRTMLGAALSCVPGMARGQGADKQGGGRHGGADAFARAGIAIAIMSFQAGAAGAQTAIPLPQTFTLTPGGLDIATGSYRHQNTDLTSGELTLVRNWSGWSEPSEIDLWNRVENGFGHNFRMGITVQRVERSEGGTFSQRDWLAVVHIDERSYMFRRAWGETAPFSVNGGTQSVSLGWTGGNQLAQQIYTFTDRDGTKYVFGRPGAGAGNAANCSGYASCAYVAYVERPNGDRLDFDYDSTGKLLKLVRDSKGFAIAFEHSGTMITKACAINLAQSFFTPGAACPSGVPTATYGYSSSTFTYLSPTGGTYSYSLETSQVTSKTITLPGASQPWMTIQGAGSGITRQDFADGSWWTYSLNESQGTYGATGSYTGPAGKTSFALQRGASWDINSATYFEVPAGGPSYVTDPLGRTTFTDYCIWVTDGFGQTLCSARQVPLRQINPEGDEVLYTIDGSDNVTQAVFKAKPGSGLPDRTMSATYSSAPASRNKPTSVTDARGNTTTYTYDAVHGGVLTETGPAVGGVSPVKRYGYVQRYVWLANSAGGYAQAASPVWVLAEERSCRTSATVGNACSGGTADEVVVSYDYGPNSGPNNLLLRGKVVSADGVSLRSCYGYDARGNRIFETSPRAGLSVCQ